MFFVHVPRRGCPCPVAGRSLPASSLQLTRRRLRSGILPALAVYAGSRGTGTPPDFCAMSRLLGRTPSAVPETGGFQEKIARCDVFREVSAEPAKRTPAGCRLFACTQYRTSMPKSTPLVKTYSWPPFTGPIRLYSTGLVFTTQGLVALEGFVGSSGSANSTRFTAVL